MPKQVFRFRKAALGFFDLTRWIKDSLGTIRGIVLIAVVMLTIFGVRRVSELMRRPQSQVGNVVADNSSRVEVKKIDSQKNSILGIF